MIWWYRRRYAQHRLAPFMTDSLLHLVLCQPEIPPNTGNINRFCIQATIHGIALKLSIPPSDFRRAGRDPNGKDANSYSGVACLK